MAWLVGLIVAVLVILLLLLILPPRDWQALGDWFRRAAWRRRRQPGLEGGADSPAPVEQTPIQAGGDRLAGRLKGFLERLFGSSEKPPARRWTEEMRPSASGSPAESWQDRRGRPTLERLAQSVPGESRPARAESPQRASVTEVRVRLILFFAVLLVAGLVISLVLAPRLPPLIRRPAQLTIVLADLDVQGLAATAPAETGVGQELLDFLRGEFRTAGLTEAVVSLALVHETPRSNDAAYDLVRSSNADMLLWGSYREGFAAPYALTLTVNPRPMPKGGELEEYLQAMMTPDHFPLTGIDRQALDREDLAGVLVWLSHFYLANFDRIGGQLPDGRPPEAVQCPVPPLDVTTFHCAGLMWLRGEYAQARATYSTLSGAPYTVGLGGEPAPPCAAATSRVLCAAAFNNQAVALLTEVSQGTLPPASLRQAVPLLLKAAEVAPDSAAVFYTMGQVHLARRDWKQAVDSLRKAVDLNLQHGRVLAALSAAYLGANDVGGAEYYARRAVEVDGSLAEAHLAMGRYWLGVGKFEEAGRELDRALELARNESKRRFSQEVAVGEAPRPNVSRALYLAAWAHRNDPVMAHVRCAQANRFLLQKLTEGEPTFLEYLWNLLTGAPSPMDLAWQEVHQGLAGQPNSFDLLYLLGYMHAVEGAYEDAAAAYQQAQALDDLDPAPYLALAWVYRVQGKLDLAREQYRLLVEKAIDPARGYFGQAEIAKQEGNREEALTHLDRAVSVDPDYAEAHLQLGFLALESGNEADAMALFELAAEKAGTENWIRLAARVVRGEIILEQYLKGKVAGVADVELLDRARQEFVRSQQREESERPGFPMDVTGVVIRQATDRGRDYQFRYLSGLARIAFEEEDLNEAGRLFRQVLQQDPGNYSALYGLGRVLLAQGQSGSALQHFRQAVGADRTSITARYYLGVAYYAQMEVAGARSSLEQVLELCQQQQDWPRRKADDLEGCVQAATRLEMLKSSSP